MLENNAHIKLKDMQGKDLSYAGSENDDRPELRFGFKRPTHVFSYTGLELGENLKKVYDWKSVSTLAPNFSKVYLVLERGAFWARVNLITEPFWKIKTLYDSWWAYHSPLTEGYTEKQSTHYSRAENFYSRMKVLFDNNKIRVIIDASGSVCLEEIVKGTTGEKKDS